LSAKTVTAKTVIINRPIEVWQGGSEMLLDGLFELFLKEKQYVKNVSPLTIKAFRLTWLRWNRCMENVDVETLNKPLLTDFIIKLRQTGNKDTTCNKTIREMNSFLTWLHENDYTKDHLKMKQLRTEKTVHEDFTDIEIQMFLNWKPKRFTHWRLYTLICTLVDTGIRIDEALTLQRSKIDLDNMLLTVYGKGRKERVVPFSVELRKVLWKFLTMHPNELVFSNRDGGKLRYRNMLRDLQTRAADLGISGKKISFHQFRYGYALNFIREGGDPFHLQRLMGHSSLATTMGYVRLVTEDLQAAHVKTSRLNRLRGN
jgi:site-specific recombinase XerD